MDHSQRWVNKAVQLVGPLECFRKNEGPQEQTAERSNLRLYATDQSSLTFPLVRGRCELRRDVMAGKVSTVVHEATFLFGHF